ncbi:MAG: hypothetical protein Q8L29_03545 [archaeon]|nr:hypothetical protein [archaeon]
MMWEIIILLIAIPIGYLIAWTARDELLAGRIWFKLLIIASFITAIVFYMMEKRYIVFSSAFIAIISGISLWKSYNKKWTKKRV